MVNRLPPPQSVATDRLRFDPRNPRLQEEHGLPTQDEILAVLWRDFAVDEIALSIAANGFFSHEPLLAEPSANDFTVIEGNRRLAAVRLLLSSEMRQRVGATNLPTIETEAATDLQSLPVIVTTRDAIWEYVGFRHVNGPQQWRSFSKAEYIAWVHNELGISLEDIARHIGDQHATVARLYRAYMAIQQAQQAGVYRLDDRYKPHFSFSHLYTGFNYSGIQSYVGLSPDAYTSTPIPPTKLKELGELCEWLYGSRSKRKQPLVQSQNPDLRHLDEVLQSLDGVAALRQGLPLGLARDISKGDPVLFREAMVSAKYHLQEARGKLLTGYKGEADLIATAEDIVLLANSVREEMEAKRSTHPRPTRSGS